MPSLTTDEVQFLFTGIMVVAILFMGIGIMIGREFYRRR